MTAPSLAPVPDSLPVGIRRPTREDLPFVLSAWKHGARELPEFAAVEGGTGDEQHFGAWFGKRIERALRASSTQVLLAHDLEDPTSLHGFVCVNRVRRGVLWIYVKQAFRKMGLGRRLLDEGLPAWTPPLRVAYAECDARLPHYTRTSNLGMKVRCAVYDPSCWEP